MNITFSELSVADLVGWIAAGIAALSIFIEISPIKINPWSWIAKKIGRAINAEVIEEVNDLKTGMENMKSTFDEYAAKDARSKILRFGDELLHEIRHSKDAFDDILIVITEYEAYCDAHPEFKNRITERTTKDIIETYDKCRTEHTFL